VVIVDRIPVFQVGESGMAKCKNCGYLGLLPLGENGQLAEANDRYRKEGEHDGNLYECKPRCYMGIKIHREVQIIPEWKNAFKQTIAARIRQVIGRDRKCELQTDWLANRSPKEHYDMLYHKAVIEAQTTATQAAKDSATALTQISVIEKNRDSDAKSAFWKNLAVSILVAAISAYFTAKFTSSPQPIIIHEPGK
jgi:hypothetical protein